MDKIINILIKNILFRFPKIHHCANGLIAYRYHIYLTLHVVAIKQIKNKYIFAIRIQLSKMGMELVYKYKCKLTCKRSEGF